MMRAILATFALALGGCAAVGYGVASLNAGEWNAVKDRARSQAAGDFSCTPEAVEIREVTGHCGSQVDTEHGCTVYAVGCGKWAAYYQDEQKKWQRQGDVQSGALPASLSSNAR